MKKKLLLAVGVLLSISTGVFANVFPVSSGMTLPQCTPNPAVTSDTQSDFCTVFPKSVASCWPPVGFYKDFTKTQMTFNYNLMTRFYGSLKAACDKTAASRGSTPQKCIDQWTCYMQGGTDSQGGLCSGTKSSCL